MKDLVRTTNWGVNQRLKYIDSKLYWEGRINRSDLVDTFTISVQQASSDFSAYHNAAPGNLLYDPRLKGYIASSEFKPLFEVARPAEYLTGIISDIHTLVATGRVSRFQGLPTLERRMDPLVVRRILNAVFLESAVEIVYHSFGRPEESRRWIEPHSVATDGDRWHVRAYCHQRRAFADFNLSRIESILGQRKSEVPGSLDLDWHTFSEVEIVPHPKMEEFQRALLEKDLDMIDGRLVFQVRNAMLLYFINRYGRLTSLDSDNPNIYQVVLNKESELRLKQKECTGAVSSSVISGVH